MCAAYTLRVRCMRAACALHVGCCVLVCINGAVCSAHDALEALTLETQLHLVAQTVSVYRTTLGVWAQEHVKAAAHVC